MPIVEKFDVLSAQAGCFHGFIRRVPDVDVRADRETVMQRLAPHHARILGNEGITHGKMATAEQVHGADVAVVSAPGQVPGVDALVTDCAGLVLGIYVADCAPVYFFDPIHQVVALAHSGKMGTQKNISHHVVKTMREQFESLPKDIIAVIGPCIRPPHYEFDIPREIVRQLSAEGITAIHDTQICTAERVNDYYSYRIEKGETGRMLAFLGIPA